MNRKLRRLIEEEERTEAKIEELQAHLKDLRLARKQEEDLQIIRSIRTMKLGARDLFTLLSDIQDGNISIESLPVSDSEETDAEDDITGEIPDADTETETESKRGTDSVPEREDIHG